MKEKILYAIVSILLVVVSYFVSYYGQPYLAGSQFEFITLNYLFMVPFMYFLSLLFGTGKKYTNMKRLLFLTIGAVCWIVIADFFNIDKIVSKMPACLIGAAIMYIIMIVFEKKR